MQVLKERLPCNLSGDYSNSALKGSMPMPGRGYQTPTPAKPKTTIQKSAGGDARSLRKRPCREILGTSSGSTLTNINTGSRGSELIIDYHKVAKI